MVSIVKRIPFFIAFIVSLCISQSVEAQIRIKNAADTLLDMDTVDEFAISTSFITLGYVMLYFCVSGLLEYTNPTPKTPKRMKWIKKEIRLGVFALIADVTYAGLWLWLVDRHTPYYGYYNTHEFTAWSLLMNVLTYLFVFDTWFYWTHRFLHQKWWWKNVHVVHHKFMKPSAFAQDAVHPFEAVFQGPMGHHLVSLVYPMHPIVMAVMGAGTAIYASAAHDGRAGDLNDHNKHHTFMNVNFGLYWGVWDYICGTRYDAKKRPAYKKIQEEYEKLTPNQDLIDGGVDALECVDKQD
ncbi:delta7-sterol 5-desaturase [Acrasis kona]|uniref:Delta7-sterol 5-desaturase n=1 Tax=Acrasis kona TaxID=1008807 RepID=A0AAW2YVV8_9EUKA